MHNSIRKTSFFGMVSRFLTSFVIAVVLHVILLMHVTFCTHKSQALQNNNSIITLNLSIQPQIIGNADVVKVVKKMPEAALNNEKLLEKVSQSKDSVSEKIQKEDSNKKAQVKGGDTNILPVLSSPKFLHYTPPIYPRAAKFKRQQGLVIVDVKLDEFGNQSPAFIYLSSGYKLLDAAAINAANRSVLQPVLSSFQNEAKNIANEACIARIKYQFKLKK